MEAVRAALLRAPGPVKEVAEHLASSLGKGIRVKLLMACAMDKDENVTKDAVHAAASVELLHMASLVHDDIIDEAVLRRNIPAAHSKFGKEKAVLAGDWLLCLALRQAMDITPPKNNGDESSQIDIARAFLTAAERVCLGELDERGHLGDMGLSARSYLRIIDKKTAALFCLSARAGAMAGGLLSREVGLLVRFARYFGHVFQIADDVKDYSMKEADAQKSVKNDLLTGVITMPAILAFAKEPGLKAMAADVIREGRGIEAFIARLRKTGSVEQTAEICAKYAAKARTLLKDRSMEHRRDVLEGLLEKVMGVLV